MALGGLMLKSSQTLLRLTQLLSSALILGIFSYFLAVLARHHLHKATWVKAVEGIAGAAVLWTIVASLLTCFVGGVAAFGALALILDVLFLGAFVAVTILTRAGAHSCRGYVNTPLGYGNSAFKLGTSSTGRGGYGPSYKVACRLEKAVFAVAIILFILFLLSALLQVLLVRHHRKEKRYGPSPANDYTSGSGRKGFFNRKKTSTRDAELATTGVAAVGGLEAEKHHHNMRPSHETGYTGSTVANTDPAYGGNKYSQSTVPAPGAVHTTAYVPPPTTIENTHTTGTWTTPPPRVNY